jgi:hypothetical protein
MSRHSFLRPGNGPPSWNGRVAGAGRGHTVVACWVPGPRAAPAFAAPDTGALRSATAGRTPSVASRFCCSGLNRPKSRCWRVSQRPMSSPRQVTRGTMSVSNTPPSNRACSSTWWRCQSTVRPNVAGFHSLSTAASCSARLWEGTGSLLSPPGRRMLVSHCLTGVSSAIAWRGKRARLGEVGARGGEVLGECPMSRSPAVEERGEHHHRPLGPVDAAALAVSCSLPFASCRAETGPCGSAEAGVTMAA